MIKPGTFFRNRFYVIRKMSHGGMGVVYLGYDLEANEFVAIKTMFAELLGKPGLVKRSCWVIKRVINLAFIFKGLTMSA